MLLWSYAAACWALIRGQYLALVTATEVDSNVQAANTTRSGNGSVFDDAARHQQVEAMKLPVSTPAFTSLTAAGRRR